MKKKNLKKLIILNIPYVVIGLVATNVGEAFRIAGGTNASEKVQSVVLDGCFGTAFTNPLPSLHPCYRRNLAACGLYQRQECQEISAQSGIWICQVGKT